VASASGFVGSLGVGWGLFNLVEGIIDHQILGIHHVRTDVPSVLLWDLGFLVFGALLVAFGATLIRAGQHKDAALGSRSWHGSDRRGRRFHAGGAVLGCRQPVASMPPRRHSSCRKPCYDNRGGSPWPS